MCKRRCACSCAHCLTTIQILSGLLVCLCAWVNSHTYCASTKCLMQYCVVCRMTASRLQAGACLACSKTTRGAVLKSLICWCCILWLLADVKRAHFTPCLHLVNCAVGCRPPPITYIHIYEDQTMSLGIFCLPRNVVIPLHNHPGMIVLSR